MTDALAFALTSAPAFVCDTINRFACPLAGFTPLKPNQSKNTAGGDLGLGLGLGLDLKPEVDDLFGPSDTGVAGNFGLVNNPQGWTENQQEVDRTRVLEMTADFMHAEQERQQLFGGVQISSQKFDQIVRTNTSQAAHHADARRLGLNLDDGNLSPDEAETSPRPMQSLSPKFGQGPVAGTKRGRRGTGHSRSISERENAMHTGSSWEWRDK